MQFEVASLTLGFALVATCFGAPLDIGTGLDLTPGDTTFWNKDFLIGDQKVQLGLGWLQDAGTIVAGAKVQANIKGKEIPISAALRTNTNDWKKITFELGTNVDEKVSGVIIGNVDGEVAYQVNARLPIDKKGVSSVGASLVGKGTQENTLTAGIGLKQGVLQAQIGFEELTPSLFNVQIGTNAE